MRWVLGLGLTVYDLLAWRWNHRHYDADDMRELCPGINGRGLLGGYRYFDAQTDDARLVLRVIREAVRAGGVALNYAPVESLLRKNSGAVCGVALRDQTTGRTAEAQASVVINATGAWADSVRAYVSRPPRLRLLRGSHLIFSARRLALRRAITFMHPLDWRPVFALPWEGITLFGTTDVDHGQFVETDPVMSEDEIEYLLTALHYAFPALELNPADAQGAFSGVRAVVGTGQSNPSKESREHVLWREAGLLTVTGGKLTTFRLMAHNALRAVRAHLPHHPALDIDQKTPGIPPDVGSQDAPSRLRDDPATLLRLAGRYGADASTMMAAIHSDELESIGDSTALWTELRWAARAEGVVHLEDLLLRRVRLGLLLPQGGRAHMARIRAIAQSELGWDDERWATEAEAYARVWARSYSLPT